MEYDFTTTMTTMTTSTTKTTTTTTSTSSSTTTTTRILALSINKIKEDELSSKQQQKKCNLRLGLLGMPLLVILLEGQA